MDSSSDAHVVLKPLFGLVPGKYLFILYLAIVMAILFAVLFLPGILKPGMRILVTSEPSGAAIRLNDVYRGTSPAILFVPTGTQRITLAAPGFEEQYLSVEGRAAIFASLFRRPRPLDTVVLIPQDPLKALAEAAAEYASWSLAGRPDESWQIPLVLSEAAWRMGPFLMDKTDASRALLHAATRFARWPQQQRDLLRAAFLVDSAGLPPSPVSTVATGRAILRWLSDTPTAPLALAESLDGDARNQLLGSPWYAKAASSAVPSAPWRAGKTPLSLGSVKFAHIADTRGQQPSWWIAQREVSLDEWQRFIDENPFWDRSNIDELLANTLVNEDYLEGFQGVSVPGKARHSISWHAAKAFCTWMEARLPPNLADYEVRLPRESEWEIAANMTGQLPLEDMNDGLWEWCDDPWAHYPSFMAPTHAIEALSSPMRTVKGGSWANRIGDAQKTARGAQLPQSCTPFTGFRPVIAKRAAVETP